MASICDIEPAKAMMHRHIGDAVQMLERMKAFVEKESVVGLRSRLVEVRLSLGFLANEIQRMEDAHEADRAARERMAFSAKMRQANDGQDFDDDGQWNSEPEAMRK